MSHIDVRRLRLQSGIGQRELARRAGITARMAVRWDQGAQPRADRLPKLAEILGCSIDELYSQPVDAE
jgi:transcriptional regulator with XRE-family HTH domain